jgi:hypothetical protein
MSMQRVDTKLAMLIAITALLVRFALYSVTVLPYPHRALCCSDAESYHRLALNLIHGHGFSLIGRIHPVLL